MAKKEEFLKRLGNHLREKRLAKDLSVNDLALRVGKERKSIHRVEEGVSNPTAFFLSELAEGLEIDLKELLDFKYGKVRKSL